MGEYLENLLTILLEEFSRSEEANKSSKLIEKNILLQLMNKHSKLTRDTILIIGDVMLDEFWDTKFDELRRTRTAKNDEIIITLDESIECSLGGAGFAYKAFNKINSDVDIIAVIGKDDQGEKIKSLINSNYLIQFENEKIITTWKLRIHIPSLDNMDKTTYRFDRETTQISDDTCIKIIEEKIIEYFEFTQNSPYNLSAVIICDHQKGVVIQNNLEVLFNSFYKYKGNKKFPWIIIDPKYHWQKYDKLNIYQFRYYFIPNAKEFLNLFYADVSDSDEINNKIISQEIEILSTKFFIKYYPNCSGLIIKLSSLGLYYVVKENKNIKITRLPAFKGYKVNNNIGLGDTLLTFFTDAIIRGFSEKNALWVGSLAAYFCGVNSKIPNIKDLIKFHNNIKNLNQDYVPKWNTPIIVKI